MLAETNQAVKEKKDENEKQNSNRGGVDYTRFLDDNYIDPNINKRLNIKCYEKGNEIYGHEVYKKELARFLPNECQQQYQRWGYGWYQIPEKTPWNGDAGNGDDKSKEGYLPIKEDDEDKMWKRPGWGRYQNPWEYDTNSYRNYRPNARAGPPPGYSESDGKKAVDEDAKDDTKSEPAATSVTQTAPKSEPAVKPAADAPSNDVPGSDLPPEL
jgi:hypothetical protein